VPGHAFRPLLAVWGSGWVFIRSASAMRFGLRVLNRRNWSSSSNLTSTKASHLISRPPEKRKVGGSIPPLATNISAGSGLRRITRHKPRQDLQPFHAANIRPSRVLAARRKLATSRRRTSSGRFQTRACQATTARDRSTTASRMAETRSCGRCLTFWPNRGSGAVGCWPACESRGRRDLPPLEVAERVEGYGDIV
jgi:hypothetical protein